MLRIEFSKRTLKFLEKCENELYDRLIHKVKKLSENPYPTDSRKLKKEKVFRVRVGKYRILYVVYGDHIFISYINKRGNVYKNDK